MTNRQHTQLETIVEYFQTIRATLEKAHAHLNTLIDAATETERNPE